MQEGLYIKKEKIGAISTLSREALRFFHENLYGQKYKSLFN